MVNVAEETKNPQKTLPKAIFLTLAITAIVYTLISLVAVSIVSPTALQNSDSPLSLVYHELTGNSVLVISSIAIFASFNSILVQVISRSLRTIQPIDFYHNFVENLVV